MTQRIAVFSDGTGQSAGRPTESNVLRLCKMLEMTEHSGQVAIYDPGIGTHVSGRRLNAGLNVSDRVRLADSNPKSSFVRKLRTPLELTIGTGAESNIKQLYLALVDAYSPGDSLYLFGFSRGAFTVRALAGLLYRCGLLNQEAATQIDTAWGWYQRHYTAMSPAERKRYRDGVDAFRRQYSRPCNIRFLGVWDTVKSVGYLSPMNLPHTRHNPVIETVRHALALDERRSFYQPTTWGGLTADTRPAVQAPASFDLDTADAPDGKPQDVKEVWFPGNHSDIGGGYPDNERVPANNALRWMISEARQCRLEFDEAAYKDVFPNEQDGKVISLHDEMTNTPIWSRAWWLVDRTPRLDLINEPPPPRTELRRKPAGPRNLARLIRRETDNTISVHVSAQGVYATREPWRDIATQFVTTTPNDFTKR